MQSKLRKHLSSVIPSSTTLHNVILCIKNLCKALHDFLKEAKQLLGLGKCQSTNFDVQVAQTTITMVRYLLISLRHRMEAYQTIGGIFKNLKQDYVEHKLNKRLLLAIVDILEVLDLLVKDIDINSIARRLVLYSESLSFLTNPPHPANNSKLAA